MNLAPLLPLLTGHFGLASRRREMKEEIELLAALEETLGKSVETEMARWEIKQRVDSLYQHQPLPLRALSLLGAMILVSVGATVFVGASMMPKLALLLTGVAVSLVLLGFLLWYNNWTDKQSSNYWSRREQRQALLEKQFASSTEPEMS